MNAFTKKRLWYAFRVELLGFIGSRIMGWIFIALMASALSATQTALWLSEEIQARFVCNPKG